VKNLVEFLKARWVVLVLALIVVVAVPAGWIISAGMAGSIRAEFDRTVKAATAPLVNPRITYEFDPLDPSGPSGRIEKSAVPNQALNAWFRTQMAAQKASSEKVIRAAELFNMGLPLDAPAEAIRGQLIPGFFPTVTDDQRARLLDFARRYLVETFPALLTRFNAGPGTDLARLATDLAGERRQLQMQVGGPARPDPSQLTAEENRRIEEQLRDIRLRRLQADAAKIDLYADVRAFQLPPFNDQVVPTLAQCWDWQERYWIIEDIFTAIALANGHSTPRTPGRPVGVANAVVKRVMQLTIEPNKWGFDARFAAPPTGPGGGLDMGGGMGGVPGGVGGFGPGDRGPAPAPAVGPGGAPLDPSVSITGRVSGPQIDNRVYDVRTATLVAVMATRDVNRFIDALARTNFLTVLDLRIETADFLADLRDGYYYGDSHVSRVTMVIEAVTLRSWTERLMPARVKEQLGIATPSGQSPQQ
jgi:hypothetical protein